ncbi:hypothetical protein JZ751_003444, partial [Albula glossodonta]
MGRAQLACVHLCMLVTQTLARCAPENYTLQVERHECAYCMAINTTICSGFCYSRDTNMKDHGSKKLLVQRGCMYKSLVYHTVKLLGCPHDVDPYFSYPVPLLCRCSRCRTSK